MVPRYLLLAFLLNFTLAMGARGAAEDGESLMTPNQQRRVVQVNHDLPQDFVDQKGDSKKVAELRAHLRQTYGAYKQAAKQYGPGTTQSRAAAHQVMDVQNALHHQFVLEEAIPAISVSQIPQNQ